MDKIKDWSKQKLGEIGEQAVVFKLKLMGYDVVNLNNVKKNYKKVDLLVINPDTMESQYIQVKTTIGKISKEKQKRMKKENIDSENFHTGFTSDNTGYIANLKEDIIGPWVFVLIRQEDKELDFEFYVLTKEETFNLIKESNDWYINKWNRNGNELSNNTLVGLDLKWIKGENDGGYKNKPLFQNPLKGISSQERWDKIFNIPSTNDDLLCSRM